MGCGCQERKSVCLVQLTLNGLIQMASYRKGSGHPVLLHSSQGADGTRALKTCALDVVMVACPDTAAITQTTNVPHFVAGSHPIHASF